MTSGIHSRADLDRYLVAFNNNDTPVYTSFYAPDAEMALGPVVCYGLDAIKDFFATGRMVISEHIAPETVIISDHAVAITATITFTAKVDIKEPFFDIGPAVAKGGGYTTLFTIFYELNEDKQFKKIYAGRVKPTKTFRAGKL
ncbi:hypothetical protein DL95DRAFT_415291 [Leptodontidium sp. 2 PMI_412]|nr:hypothetical protein DL95DRAFT_415291 [Leptodontidium sp. 2 PMI_412]